MHLLLRAAATAAILLPLAVAPVSAQNYRGAFGIYGGGVWFSDLNDGDDRFFDDVFFDDFFIDDNGFIVDELFFLDRRADLSLESGWIVGSQLEYWFGNGRFGIRANGSYTERPFDVDRNFFDEVIIDGEIIDGEIIDIFDFGDSFGDVNVWFADGDLMFRILRPERNRTFAPYLTLGAGVVIYNPAGDATLVFPLSNAIIGDGRLVDIDFDDDFDIFEVDNDGNSETEFALVFGIGTDILPAGFRIGRLPLGLRLELVDHYTFDSPAQPIIGDDFDGVHNVRLTAGVHALFGRLFPEPVAVVTPPPAPPPPPPPPAEEAVTVCVIDPQTGQIKEIQAVYMPSTGDTLVQMNGQRVDIGTAYPTTAPVYARNASWFVTGQPLSFTVMGTRYEWVTFGGTRIIDPDDLVLLGRVDGLPVYADADDVAAVRARLNGMGELDDMLERDAELREVVDDLDVVYVAVDINCVFQPLRRLEEVRKVRG